MISLNKGVLPLLFIFYWLFPKTNAHLLPPCTEYLKKIALITSNFSTIGENSSCCSLHGRNDSTVMCDVSVTLDLKIIRHSAYVSGLILRF